MSQNREEVIQGLKKSKSIVGPIYPVIIKRGTMEIIDGITRKQADPTWPEREEEFPDKRFEILFRMHANYRRQVSRKETETQLLMLADIFEIEGVPRERIASKLSEITPFSLSWIEQLLPKKYKEVKFAPRKVSLVRPTNFVKEKTISSKNEEDSEPQISEPSFACPLCHTTLEIVRCPACLRDIKVKDFLRKNFE